MTRIPRNPVLCTVDVVPVFSLNGTWCTVVIESTKPHLAGKLVFAGGHRDASDYNLRVAAVREAKEEINLDITPEQLQIFMDLSTTGRDIRPRFNNPATPEEAELFDRLTIVYLVELPVAPSDLQAGDDAAKLHITPLSDLMPERMGYDHGEVVKALKKRYGISA